MLALWEYQAAHGGALPDDPMVAQELEEIANKLIGVADVNKQVLPNIPRELIECVCHALTAFVPLADRVPRSILRIASLLMPGIRHSSSHLPPPIRHARTLTTCPCGLMV